ncbi:hypothetical protein [Nonomuraea sp. bgisy101]|uniref:hypothetical protein n=1 Tax=Nonomuraea sp. bgisy101 TaxID=3413784 RepID=UPI003D754D15
MAKQSGLGDRLWVSGYNLSGDIGSLGRIGGGLAGTQDVTGIDKSAFERVGLARDGSFEYVAFWNTALDRAHDRLSLLPTTDQILTYGRGAALGSPAASLVGKQIDYNPTRGNDGSLTLAVQTLANGYGIDWGRQLTAGERTDTGATNGSSVDFGTGSTLFGLQAFLHVTAFTGTDATIKLQQSSDNGAGDAWADVVGGAFTQVTAGPTSERIQTARNQTVERYLRVVTTTTGGFSSLTFVVAASRNDTEVLF